MCGKTQKKRHIDLRLFFVRAAFLIVLCVSMAVFAQEPCTHGLRVEGFVADPSGAAVPGAQVRSSDNQQTTTDASGRFVFTCVSASSAIVTVQADGFSAATARAIAITGPQATPAAARRS